jgi:hypothetical protein
VQLVNFILLFSRGTIALKSLLNRVQQILVAKRLCQKFHGARLQSPHRHGYVAMCRYKDDWNLNSGVSQPTLEIESAHLGQPYVQNQATRVRGPFLVQKLLAGRKALCAQTNGLNQILDGPAYATIIIDDKHGGDSRWFHH